MLISKCFFEGGRGEGGDVKTSYQFSHVALDLALPLSLEELINLFGAELLERR